MTTVDGEVADLEAQVDVRLGELAAELARLGAQLVVVTRERDEARARVKETEAEFDGLNRDLAAALVESDRLTAALAAIAGRVGLP